jgi:hypothetical protein
LKTQPITINDNTSTIASNKTQVFGEGTQLCYATISSLYYKAIIDSNVKTFWNSNM